MKRLLLDQGLPRSAAVLLTQADGDVVDIAIVRRAHIESRVCVTLDADFHSLLATSGESGPSVIRIRKEGLDAMALVTLLQGIWAGIEEALKDGALVTVTDRPVRVRRMPVVTN